MTREERLLVDDIIERSKHDQDSKMIVGSEIRAAIGILESEIARLRKAIEDAPHPIWCYANPEVNHRNLGPCDCWKSKALGEKNGKI